ncbi:MAG: SRPBCC family protein [Rhodocyclaceae bacterium]|nr:SRPBCC family protein [Rhodocyclaceae bacterium]
MSPSMIPFRILAPALLLATLASAGAALAADLTVSESVALEASPSAVWAVLGKFSGLPGWHPAVANTEIVKGNDNAMGAVRSITTRDGAVIVEELLSYDGSAHSMTYRIAESPLPVKGYVSTLAVAPSGSGSVVFWRSGFERDPAANDISDDKAREIVRGIYRAGFEGLRAALGESGR